MFMFTPHQALVVGAIVSPIILIVMAYFTHASSRHFAGAVVGACAYGAVNLLLDRLAFTAGWCQYPSWAASGLLPLPCIPAGIVGGAFGLIGWQTMGRFGWRGLISFLIGWSVRE